MRIISGSLKGRKLLSVEGEGYRPAMGKVREAIFSMLLSQGIHWSQTRVLDLFAGSGSLAFEALSRGASHASLVENSKRAVLCLQKNVQNFDLSGRASVYGMTVESFFRSYKGAPFSLIFIDPPYGKKILQESLKGLERNGLYTENAILIAEIEETRKFQKKALKIAQKTLEKVTDENSQEKKVLTKDILDELPAAFAEPFFDRSYGQTRILAWHMTKE